MTLEMRFHFGDMDRSQHDFVQASLSLSHFPNGIDHRSLWVNSLAVLDAIHNHLPDGQETQPTEQRDTLRNNRALPRFDNFDLVLKTHVGLTGGMSALNRTCHDMHFRSVDRSCIRIGTSGIRRIPFYQWR
jgi:hypothetical protein